MIRLGVSQISGASRTSVGGYQEEIRPTDTEQFDVSDQRSLDEVVRWLMEMGYIPSFCTACYREGRTGDRFMSLCKSGQIQNCCHPNALMTLKEFLMDYYRVVFDTTDEKAAKEYLENEALTVSVNGVPYTRISMGIYDDSETSFKATRENGVVKYLDLSADGFSEGDNTVTIEADGYEV